MSLNLSVKIVRTFESIGVSTGRRQSLVNTMKIIFSRFDSATFFRHSRQLQRSTLKTSSITCVKSTVRKDTILQKFLNMPSNSNQNCPYSSRKVRRRNKRLGNLNRNTLKMNDWTPLPNLLESFNLG